VVKPCRSEDLILKPQEKKKKLKHPEIVFPFLSQCSSEQAFVPQPTYFAPVYIYEKILPQFIDKDAKEKSYYYYVRIVFRFSPQQDDPNNAKGKKERDPLFKLAQEIPPNESL